MNEFIPCEGCAQPEHCGSYWPDDDPHMAGRLRGCFGEKSGSLQVTTCAGRTTVPQAKGYEAPSWEKGRAGEARPGGGFMPYLKEGGKQMGVKEHESRRSDVARVRDAQRNGKLDAVLKPTSHSKNS